MLHSRAELVRRVLFDRHAPNGVVAEAGALLEVRSTNVTERLECAIALHQTLQPIRLAN